MDNTLIEQLMQLVNDKGEDFWIEHSHKLEFIQSIVDAWLNGQTKLVSPTRIIYDVKIEILRTLMLLNASADEKASNESKILIKKFGFADSAVAAAPDPARCITFFQVGNSYEAYGYEAELISDFFQRSIIEFYAKDKSIKIISFDEYLLTSIITSLENSGYKVTIFSLKNDIELMF